MHTLMAFTSVLGLLVVGAFVGYFRADAWWGVPIGAIAFFTGAYLQTVIVAVFLNILFMSPSLSIVTYRRLLLLVHAAAVTYFIYVIANHSTLPAFLEYDFPHADACIAWTGVAWTTFNYSYQVSKVSDSL